MTSYYHQSSRASADLQATIDAYAEGSYFRSAYSVLCRHAAPVVSTMAARHLAHFETVPFLQHIRSLKGTAC